MANGPTFTISNGLSIPSVSIEKTDYIFIAGFKNPSLASAIGHHIDEPCQTTYLGREVFLKRMAAARIVVLLPHETEGFFLPALEAMSLAEIVVVPDCVGNRSFCIDIGREGGNCLMPSYDLASILDAIKQARALLNDASRLDRLRHNMIQTLHQHRLERERDEFLELMLQVDELWHAE